MKFLLLAVVSVLGNLASAYFDVSSTTSLQERLQNIASLHYGSCEKEVLFNGEVPPRVFRFNLENVKLQAAFYKNYGKNIGLGRQHIIYAEPEDDGEHATKCSVMYNTDTNQFECNGEPLKGDWGFRQNIVSDPDKDDLKLEAQLSAGIPVADLRVKIREISQKLDQTSNTTAVLILGQKRLMTFERTTEKCPQNSPGNLQNLIQIDGMITEDGKVDLQTLYSIYYDGEKFYWHSDCSTLLPEKFRFKGYKPNKHSQENFDYKVHFVGMGDARRYLHKLGQKYRSECQSDKCTVDAIFKQSQQTGKINDEGLVRKLCHGAGEDFALYVRAETFATGQNSNDSPFAYSSLVYFDNDGGFADTRGTKTLLGVNFDSVGLYDEQYFGPLLRAANKPKGFLSRLLQFRLRE